MPDPNSFSTGPHLPLNPTEEERHRQTRDAQERERQAADRIFDSYGRNSNRMVDGLVALDLLGRPVPADSPYARLHSSERTVDAPPDAEHTPELVDGDPYEDRRYERYRQRRSIDRLTGLGPVPNDADDRPVEQDEVNYPPAGGRIQVEP